MERSVNTETKKEATVTFAGTVERETEKAVLFQFVNDEDGRSLGSHWIPKSKIKNLIDNHAPGESIIVIPDWIARDRKLA